MRERIRSASAECAFQKPKQPLDVITSRKSRTCRKLKIAQSLRVLLFFSSLLSKSGFRLGATDPVWKLFQLLSCSFPHWYSGPASSPSLQQTAVKMELQSMEMDRQLKMEPWSEAITSPRPSSQTTPMVITTNGVPWARRNKCFSYMLTLLVPYVKKSNLAR